MLYEIAEGLYDFYANTLAANQSISRYLNSYVELSKMIGWGALIFGAYKLLSSSGSGKGQSSFDESNHNFRSNDKPDFVPDHGDNFQSSPMWGHDNFDFDAKTMYSNDGSYASMVFNDPFDPVHGYHKWDD
ncbi:MAG: hypothetical protein NZ694_10515 [Tepidimonas sp.]|nr:hypothetical protein [Tepidimonas sp.]